MAKDSQRLELTKRHQLIDLNKEKVNFELKFNIESETGGDFHVIIMTQAEVDNYDNLDDIDMRLAPGKISGSISSKENKYDNYVLILKSETNMFVNVMIDLEDVEPLPVEPTPVESYPDYNSVLTTKQVDTAEPIWKTTWFWIVLIVSFLLFSFFFYNYVSVRKQNAEKSRQLSTVASTQVDDVAPAIPAVPVEPSSIYEDPKKTTIYNTLKDIAETSS
jgi:hypothetical protein